MNWRYDLHSSEGTQRDTGEGEKKGTEGVRRERWGEEGEKKGTEGHSEEGEEKGTEGHGNREKERERLGTYCAA